MDPNLRNTDNASRLQDGFSLLEVLVSLALISVTSLLLYRMVADQFALSQRIERINQATLDSWSRRQVFADGVGGLVPAWPGDETDKTFHGTPNVFTGISTQSQFTLADTLVQVRFALEESQLIYQEDGTSIVLEDLPAKGAFSYLGEDFLWYDTWPPKVQPQVGTFDDRDMYDTPQLPVAIRLKCEAEACVDWLRRLDWQDSITIRRQDILDF